MLSPRWLNLIHVRITIKYVAGRVPEQYKRVSRAFGSRVDVYLRDNVALSGGGKPHAGDSGSMRKRISHDKPQATNIDMSYEQLTNQGCKNELF